MASPTDSTFTCPSTCVSINTTPGVLLDKKEPIATIEPPSINRVLNTLNDARKEQFISRLVESAVWILETIWPATSRLGEIQGQFPGGSSSVRSISLKRFIQEVLRRSRSSFSTLHVALYYLVQLKPQIIALSRNRSSEPKNTTGKVNILACPRRCFLSSLMVADKFLQDRNFSARAWAKISGLQASELSTNMLDFLKALDWKTFVAGDVYAQWSELLFENALLDMPEDELNAATTTTNGDMEVSPVTVYTPAASPVFGESEFSRAVLKRSFDEDDVRQTKRRNI